MPGPVSLTRTMVSLLPRVSVQCRPALPSGVNLMALSTRLATASNKEIPVATHAQPLPRPSPQIDILVLGDRFIDIATPPAAFRAAGRPPKAADRRLFSIAARRNGAVMIDSD